MPPAVRGLSDAQDYDGIAVDGVTDDVGLRSYQLAHVGSRNRAAPVRKVQQAITLIAQGFRNLHGSTRVELEEIIVGALNPPRCGPSPNDAHGSDFGRRNSLALRQLREPFAHALVRNHAASLVIRPCLDIETRFQSIVRRDVEDRRRFSFGHEDTLSMS